MPCKRAEFVLLQSRLFSCHLPPLFPALNIAYKPIIIKKTFWLAKVKTVLVITSLKVAVVIDFFSACKVVIYRYHNIEVKPRETFHLVHYINWKFLPGIQCNIMLRFNFFLWSKLWFLVWWSMVMHVVSLEQKINRNWTKERIEPHHIIDKVI